jgi:hypothetical protein
LRATYLADFIDVVIPVGMNADMLLIKSANNVSFIISTTISRKTKKKDRKQENETKKMILRFFLFAISTVCSYCLPSASEVSEDSASLAWLLWVGGL